MEPCVKFAQVNDMEPGKALVSEENWKGNSSSKSEGNPFMQQQVMEKAGNHRGFRTNIIIMGTHARHERAN